MEELFIPGHYRNEETLPAMLGSAAEGSGVGEEKRGAEDNTFLFLKSLNYCAILDFLVTCVKAPRLK